jgi:uncharacterized Ntn-hydrolase superfamily protein
MTFSIIAVDTRTSQMGVAVSTANLAVGAVGYQARAGVGLIATQADPHPILGYKGLRLLAEGIDPGMALDILLKDDTGRLRRQIHLIDANGNTTGYTGDCVDWAGHQPRQGFSVAGNMLVGEETLTAMVAAYQINMKESLPERLMRALEAGQAAGGDKRGRQSAALYVVSTEVYADIDLRVDDHADPIVELRRLYEESKKPYYATFRKIMPTQTNPAGIYDPKLIDKIATQLAKQKH